MERAKSMREYSDTSRENWHKNKDKIHEKSMRAVEVFKDYPGASFTVNEALHFYVKRFGPRARNEFAKAVSYVCDLGYLDETEKRLCTVNNKRQKTWKLHVGPIVPKVKTKTLKDLVARVKYLEALCEANGIAHTQKSEGQLNFF
jgi:hypothetical protein